MNNIKKINKGASFLIYIIIFLASGITGCKKLVEVLAPKNKIVATSIFKSNSTATAALLNIYQKMYNDGYSLSMSKESGLYADELSDLSGNQVNLYTNSLTSNDALEWNNAYNYIYQTNAILENVTNNTAITEGAAKQIIGECKLLRAFLYFNLINTYGDVPLITTSDYTTNRKASRVSTATVYRQIINDLTDAQNLLSPNYVNVSDTVATNPIDKQRPPKWAATALLARVYLYNNKYDSAEEEATQVINQNMFGLTTLDDVFLKNSQEAIWQVGIPSNNSFNTLEGVTFDGFGTPPNGITNFLLSSFEPGDNRRSHWINLAAGGGYYYPYKYKVAQVATVTEYTMFLRLGEQYLIRAEARAHLDNLPQAAADLNAIRNRAGLPNIDDAIASSQTALLAAIQHERQVELFTEWGHRWYDLKRTGQADAVMSIVCPQKGGQWESYKQLYPIPYSDIQTDHNLVQNPGY